MSSFDLPQPPQNRVSPALLVGATSPLWSYFGAVAASGMAFWWMTRWARPVNLEASLTNGPRRLARCAASTSADRQGRGIGHGVSHRRRRLGHRVDHGVRGFGHRLRRLDDGRGDRHRDR